MSKRNIRRWATNSINRLATPERRRKKRRGTNTESLEDRALLSAIDVDFSGVFNRDSIRNRSGGTNDTSDSSIDRLSNSRLVTQTFAQSESSNGNGLPDNGFFARTNDHPAVQLGYNNNDDGNNMLFLATRDQAVAVQVPNGKYDALHVFMTATNGATNLDVTLTYADGTDVQNTVVRDWFSEVDTAQVSGDAVRYELIDGMDRIFGTSTFQDSNDPAIFGHAFTVDPTRTLQSFSLTKKAGGSEGDIAVLGASANVVEYVVDSVEGGSDGNFAPGDTSLREVIELANAKPDPDVISFAASVTGDITVGSQIFLEEDVTIDGGDNGVVISGADASSIFRVVGSSTDVSLNRVTLDRGNGAGGAGAIDHQGNTLVISNSTISNSKASDRGGAIFTDGGDVTIVNSTISGNEAPDNGGGLANFNSGTLTVIGSTVTNNIADSDNNGAGQGGGIHTQTGSTTTIHNSIISGNMIRSGNSLPGNEISNDVHADSSYNVVAISGSAGGLSHDPRDGSGDGKGNIVGNNGSGALVIQTILNRTLADNGGPTMTHAVTPGGFAIDAGSNAFLDSLIKPISASASTSATDFRPAEGLIASNNFTLENYSSTNDGAGFDDAWITDDPNGGAGNDYFDGNPNPVLLFNLGHTQDLTDVVIWGYRNGRNNDVKDFTLEFSTDGGATFGDPISLTKTRYSSTNFVNTLPLGGTFAANFVRMTITDNHFGAAGNNGGDRVAFNEIRFLGRSATDQRGDGFTRVIDGDGDGTDTVDIGAFEADVPPTVTVTPLSGLTTSESGDTDTFTVVLDSEPTGDVTIAVSSSDTSEGTVDQSSLTFTTSNWNTPQSVTVMGADDSVVDGDVAYTIELAVASGGGYDGVDPDDVSVTNTDNDTTLTELVVSTDTDVSDGDFGPGELSLREAIEIANSSSLDTITFNPLMSGSTITLDGDELAMSGNLTIAGLGADKLTIDANGGSRVFRALPGSFVVLSDVSITGGDATLSSDDDPTYDNLGGGVFNDNAEVTIQNSRIYGNTAEYGAGINNWRGTLVVEGSTIDGNSVTGNGAGIYNWGDDDEANLTVANSTISGNTASGRGGGIVNWAGTGTATSLITNSSIVSNVADFGGGLSLFDSGVTLNNSLLIGNTTPGGNPADIDDIGGTVDSASANNLVGNPGTAGGLSHGTNGNILGDGSGSAISAASVIDVNLADNGGSTPTHTLVAGSPAIDAGDNANAEDAAGDPLAVDQRMQPRLVGTVDIGAVEKTLSAFDDIATTTVGDSVEIDVLGNDGAGASAEVRSLSNPDDGDVSGDGPVTYTPDSGFSGTDTFTYEVGLQADTHSNAGETSEEGNAVDVDGDWAIVGARRDDVVDRNAGAAFIYRRNGATWEKFQELRPDEIEFRDRFGYSVAISGTTVVVGARLDDVSGFKSGSVYVFEYDASQGEFIQTQKLTNGTQRSQFGHAVAIEDDTLVVGARRDRSGSANSGAAYVFARTPRGFEETHFLKADDAAKADQFGSAVAVSGDTIAVGAWKDNTGDLVDSGSVYVFSRNEGANGWGQVAKMVASDSQQFDQFGISVDIDGDTVVVGKAVRSREERASGAYIYERNEGGTDNWGETKALVSINTATFDNFGYAVRILGDDVLVGARQDNTAGNSSGAAYVHTRNVGGSDNWGHTESFFGNRRDSFGFAVGMDESTIVIGANLRNGADGEGDEDAGAVIFEDRRSETATVTVTVNQNQISGSGVGLGASEITTDDLAPIVEAARDYWRRQGLTTAQSVALDSAQINVAPLSGALLGFETGGNVTIDSDAAGHGWYVDPTPQNLHDDHIGSRMDLLSNVTHELGHVIGLADRFDESSRGEVMHGLLTLGERQLGSDSLDRAFTSFTDELDSLF